MKLLTSEQMRLLDRAATERYGIPSLILMENAAIAAAGVLLEQFPDSDEIAIVCGSGQNGGDGYAIGRHLAVAGMSVTIYELSSEVRGDAAANREICRAMELPIEPADASLGMRLQTADVIVDAMFGTGLSRPLEGMAAAAAEAINAAGAAVLAVDIPSGLDASTGAVAGVAVRADVTVTFAAGKIAHAIEPASSYCGDVVVVDISIPPQELHQIDAVELIEADLVTSWIPPRPSDSHKGTWGHVAIVSGSEGKSGAAILAARGAIRTGAGLVTVFTDRETARIVDVASVESMTRAIDWSASVAEIAEALAGRDAVLIGSGLPDDEESWGRIRDLITRLDQPLVLDAGAINAFAGRASGLAASSAPRILTPHPGEMARLLGVSTADVANDRLEVARSAAAQSGSVVLLKGSGTVIASPDGQCAVNPTGTPAMGSGGTGDVLGGIAAALLARGLPPFEAACAAAWIHGRAGEIAAGGLDLGLAALELADAIPLAVASAFDSEDDE